MALSRRPWTTTDALALAGGDIISAVAASKAALSDELAPVPRGGDERRLWEVALDERLRRLALKVAPLASPDQGKPWREVMVQALSDLPAMVALTAAKRAIHKPLTFLNEIEPTIRDLAAIVMLERREAVRRLDSLLAAPKQLALPPQADGAPLSFHEIQKMSRDMRAMGLRMGAITREQLEEVEAAEPTPTPDIEASRAIDQTVIARPPSPRVPTEADYIAMGVTRDALAAASQPLPPLVKQPVIADGPAVSDGDECPQCGRIGVVVHDGTAFCEGIGGCGDYWRPVAEAA